MNRFCDELKKAREFKQISLEEISEKTKINIKFLEGLEEGNWEVLPEAYTRAFLRTYAHYIGMNVEKVMRRFKEGIKRSSKGVSRIVYEEIGTAPPEREVSEAEIPPAELTPPAPETLRHRSRIFPILVGGGVLLVILMVVAYQLTRLQDRKKMEISSPLSMTIDTSATAQMEVEEKLPQTIEGWVVEEEGEMTSEIKLKAVALDRCWLKVSMDDEEDREYLLAEGDVIRWSASRKVRIKAGNAAGIDIFVNDQSLGNLGSKGEVISIGITPEGVQMKNVVIPIPSTKHE